MDQVIFNSVGKIFRHRPALFNWLGKERGGETIALKGVSFSAAKAEVLVLLGPNGSGKTTALKLVSTMLLPDAGSVCVGGFDARRNAAEVRRQVGIAVATERSFFPRLSARENLEFFATLDEVPRNERALRIEEVFRDTGLEEQSDTLVMKFSSGMYQRLGIARALVKHPGVLLLDEPLSGLDASLRAAVRVELALVQRALGATMLFVTHDQSEALALGHRVAVMRDGAIEQLASPRTLYERPASAFVAAFAGTPAMSLVPGEVHDGVFRARGGDLAFAAPGLRSGPVTAGFRAEAVRPFDGGEARGVVRAVEDFGAEAFVYVEGGFGSIVARCDAAAPALPVAGERIELALDATRAHFFDVHSGRRLEPVATPA